jgi:hypothetical protein
MKTVIQCVVVVLVTPTGLSIRCTSTDVWWTRFQLDAPSPSQTPARIKHTLYPTTTANPTSLENGRRVLTTQIQQPPGHRFGP